ncbi:hypothetical protein ABTE31_21085, partial [Acinetobacter baumannii]
SDELQRNHQLLNCSFWPVVPPISDAAHGSGLLSLAYLAISHTLVGKLLVAEAIRKRHFNPEEALFPHVKNVFRDLPEIAVS